MAERFGRGLRQGKTFRPSSVNSDARSESDELPVMTTKVIGTGLGVGTTSGAQSGLARSLSSVVLVGVIDLSFSLAANVFFPRAVPKVEYAAYRLFLLYAAYAGILHFGLLDGLYLRMVGRDVEAVPRELIVRVGRALLVLQALAALVAIPTLLRLKLPDESVSLPLVLVAMLVGTNLLTFHTYLLQATNHFVPVARVVGSTRTAGAVAAMLLIVTGLATARWLSLCLLVPVLMSVTLLGKTTRAMKWGQAIPPGEQTAPVALRTLWQAGAALFLGNLGITAALTGGTLLASMVLSRSLFADYAFAAGLASLMVVGFEWLSVAAAPLHAGAVRSGLSSAVWETLLLALLWLAPLVYWCAAAIVPSYLPAYRSSLEVLAWLTASLPFIGIVRVRATTVCRALGRQDLFLQLGGIGAPLVMAAVTVGWLVGHSGTSIAAGWAAGFVLVGSLVWLLIARAGRLPSFHVEAILVASAVAAGVAFAALHPLQNTTLALGAYLTVGAMGFGLARRGLGGARA